MAYADADDLMLGDLERPTTFATEVVAYLDAATRDVNLYLGQKYTVPITATVGSQTELLLRAATADLASAYYVMARASGGEDNKVNAYAMHLYTRALNRLKVYVEGDQLLDGVVVLASNDAMSAGPVAIYQTDRISPLETYYRWLETSSYATYGGR